MRVRATTANLDQSPPLKVNKDSHTIKKPSAYNNSPSSASAAKPPQRQHPVIIYTHSPKVIHTQPRDFMALVQKLTGMTRSDEPDPVVRPDKSVDSGKPDSPAEEESQRTGGGGGDDNDSSSVITEENNCGSTEQANSNNNCFVSSSSIFDSPAANQNNNNNNPYLTSLPSFPGSAADQFLCPNNQAAFFNYPDPLFLGTMRSSSISSSSSSLDAINDFRDF